MKRIVNLIFVSCLSYCLMGNNYFPSGMNWSIFIDNICESEKYSYNITVNSDTTIGDKQYQMIGEIPIREDSGMVYCYIQNYMSNEYFDYLLYDFNIQVGDSIRKTYYNEYALEDLYAKVVKIDTITLLDGRTAKRIFYDDRPFDIEYIGNTKRGFFSPLDCMVPPCGSEQLICCSVDNQPIYETVDGGCRSYISPKPYFPKGSKWESIQADVTTGIGCIPYHIETMYVSDTIINDKRYQYFICSYNGMRISDTQQLFLREENNKLLGWSSHINNSKEYVVADFNMSIGDTLKLPQNFYADGYNDTINYVVTNIDSILLDNGKKAKRLHFSNNKIPIVETIGCETTINDLFETKDYSQTSGFLSSCYFVGDQMIYTKIHDFINFYYNYDRIKDYYCGRELEITRIPYIYITDKNGNIDTVSIHYNMDLCKMPQPQFTFTDEEVKSSSHFAFLGADIGSNQQDTLFTKHLETIPLQDNDISKYRMNLYIKSDHLPVTLSWDTLFFYKSDIDGSFITTYTDWFKQNDNPEAFIAKFMDTTDIVISQINPVADFAQVSMAIGNGDFANRWFRSHSDTLSYDNRKIFEMNKEWTIVCKDTTIKRYRVEDIKHICQQDYFELKEYKVDTALQREEYVKSYYVRNVEDLDCAMQYDIETEQEKTIYDFGLGTWQHIPGSFPASYEYFTIQTASPTDSNEILILETNTELGFWPPHRIYWKRNIGSLGDLMQPFQPTTDSLLCVKIGDKVIYSRGPIKGISCNGVKDDIQQISANMERIEIIDNRLKINDDAKEIKVSLYNLQGKQVLSTTQTSIDVSQFITGVYLVVVQTDSEIYSKKIVVK